MSRIDRIIDEAICAMAQSVREDAREMRGWRPDWREGAAAAAAFILIPVLASMLLAP